MKSFAFIIAVLLSIVSVAHAAVSDDAFRLDALRKAIEANPTRDNELQYLRAFPSTFEKFRKTFCGKDSEDLGELYSTHLEHLQLLERLYDRYPKNVKAIWYGVAVNGSWIADAVGILQDQLAKYGASSTKTFAQELRSKSPQERRTIIKFLADAENYYSYHEYETILRNLRALGYGSLYHEFVLAKKQRMNKKDH